MYVSLRKKEEAKTPLDELEDDLLEDENRSFQGDTSQATPQVTPQSTPQVKRGSAKVTPRPIAPRSSDSAVRYSAETPVVPRNKCVTLCASNSDMLSNVTPRSKASVRQKASVVFASLPLSNNYKCIVVMHIVRRLLREEETRALFRYMLQEELGSNVSVVPSQSQNSSEVLARKKLFSSPIFTSNVQKVVTSHADCNAENLWTYKVKLNSLVRKLCIARSKKQFEKVEEVVQRIKQITTLRKAAKATCMSWGVMSWTVRKPVSKDNRSVTSSEITAIETFLSRGTISQSLPTKRHAKKLYMRMALTKAYEEFEWEQEMLGNRVIKFATFYKYLPKNIRCMGETPYRHCQCEICINIGLLLSACHACDVEGLPRRVTLVILMNLCPPAVGEAEALDEVDRECIMRDCSMCKGRFSETILEKNKDMDLAKTVGWHQWEKKSEFGKVVDYDKFRHTGAVSELLGLLAHSLQRYSSHMFHFKWQGEMYERRKKNMKVGEVLMQCDFAQNVEHSYAVKPQSSHWHHNQTTMHGNTVHYPCNSDTCVTKPHLVTADLLMLSDDKNHDAHAVRAFDNTALKWLHDNGVKVDRMFQYTDNAGSQYKCKQSFDDLSKRDLPWERSYGGASHAKGDCDKAFGQVKCMLSRANRTQAADVGCTNSMYKYCNENFETTRVENGCTVYMRRFFLVNDIDRSEETDCVTYVGTQRLHCVRNTGLRGVIDIRTSSCSCRPCITHNEPCEEGEIMDLFQRADISGEKRDLDFKSSMWGDDYTHKQAAPKKARQVKKSGTLLRDINVTLPLRSKPLTLNLPPELVALDQRSDKFPGFLHAAELIESVKSFDELFELVTAWDMPRAQGFKSAALPMPWDSTDTKTVKYMPCDLQEKNIPVKISADGNCLPSSVSRLLYGHSGRSREMRVRLTHDLVKNKRYHLNENFLSKGTPPGTKGFRRFYCSQSVAYREMEDDLSKAEVHEELYKKEVMASRNPGMYCGMWHLHAAANVMVRPVFCIYPVATFAPAEVGLINRKIMPLLPAGKNSTPVRLMWTVTSANSPGFTHIVPLVP